MSPSILKILSQVHETDRTLAPGGREERRLFTPSRDRPSPRHRSRLVVAPDSMRNERGLKRREVPARMPRQEVHVGAVSTLAAAADDSKVATVAAPAPAVLVVDDEVRSLEALARTLEEDFTVFTAATPEEALGVLRREFVTIILCDQRMPGTSGIDFLKRVRAEWPDPVRIVISGYTDAEDIIAGINEAGIWQYLLKPWHPEQILVTLRSAAELYRLQQEHQRLSLELRDAPPVLKQRVEAKRAQARRRFAADAIV